MLLKIMQKRLLKLFHENIGLRSRILIAVLPNDGVKCIEELQSHCANMTFSDKSRYDRTFQQVTHKEGGSEINYIKRFQKCTCFTIFQ